MNFAEALRAGAKSLQISVPDEVVESMSRHFEVLTKWASRINITTVLDPEEAATLHGLDCLLLAECFSAEDESTVLDVGSGGGFPGIVLALARPKLRLTLLEPQRKRASFLKVALAELRRPDVRVLEARLEAVSARHPAFGTDVLVSRATIPPLDLVPLAGPHLAHRGRLFLMSGAGAPPVAALELRAAEAGLCHVERREHRLPGGQTRYIDRLQKGDTAHLERR